MEKQTYLKESNHRKQMLKKIARWNSSEKKKHRVRIEKEWEK